ncbi:hypothetical protein A3D77_03250 [Candidatus Gottesmanbacteria bacterium RIFCSPHIGHO2_02_FULL_39_11]|uniref:Metallo-beta-lactamase domain-containing protein n=1 Tax=Candidatus Gottesmanbacteria bacterium RIFCSPHIGHO2_02_FULL_39_11 TaxID=1798382 RepID=A0A1F5ZNG3_9BACT|nr:MAG: hypothetical protein A3D77_03250 [Candidatus Gottesmanbacteria bacterium RIFCSPHIGHO2_02_FULL_39_11]
MNRKLFIVFFLLILLGLTYGILSTLPDGKLHIIFCNVGQGDGAYIKNPNGTDMIIDGGPDNTILACLGRHMPFYDRTIDTVLLTHPQKDHMQGLISVVERYSVRHFVIGNEANTTEGYFNLISSLKKKGTPLHTLYAGDKFQMGSVDYDVIWPSMSWVRSHIEASSSSLNTLALRNGQVFGTATSNNFNDFSYVIHIRFNDFDTLFTGDGDEKIQPEIMRNVSIPSVEVLKFPHHGSKTGISKEFLEKLSPQFSVISVGKNSYGHPSKEAIDLLNSEHINYRRTDQHGDIEVVSDGEKWSYKTQK